MLEAILVLAVLGAVWRAYAVGVKHGREERESASLKAMAESVRRGIDARRKASATNGGDPDGVRERSFRD